MPSPSRSSTVPASPARAGRGRRRPGHDRGDPPRAQLGGRGDQARARPHGVVARSSTRCSTSRPRSTTAQMRLLAQAPSLPLFMGTMSFCIEAAVEEVGGEEALDAGRHHPLQRPLQDGLAPAGRGGRDAGVPAEEASRRLHGDQGATGSTSAARRSTAPTPSTSSRRATIFPGVKLYGRRRARHRHPEDGRQRTRGLPKIVVGDINAEVAGVRTAPRRSCGSIERYGLETFRNCVERMYDHGEAVVRSYFANASGRSLRRPRRDGRRRHQRRSRSRSRSTLEVDGSTVRVDFSKAPEAQAGPVNCPIASTVSAARVIITMLAGGGEAPNEGHFRPIEVDRAARARCSTAVSPSPCFLYGWPAMQATEVVLQRRRRGDAGGGLRLLGRRHLRRWSGTATGRVPASSGATGRRIRSARAPRCTATGRTRASTTSRPRRASRRSRCGRRRTRG